MQQKFLSNLILLVVLNLVVKPVAIFGIDVSVQNRVGAEEYGLYYSLLSFTYLFNILLDLGINNFTTKNVAQYPGLMAKYIGKIAGLRLLLLLVYTVFTYGIALLLGYSKDVYGILTILIVQQFFISMIAYFRSYLSGMLLFRLDALLSILDRALLIVVCGYVLYATNTGGFQIDYFVWIQFACYVVSFLVGLFLVLRHIGKIRIALHKPISLLIIRESIPYALLIILMALFTRVDSVMLERMLDDGAKQVGYYAQGFRLIDAFFMVAMLFSNLLLPLFSKMIRHNESVKELFSISSKLLVWGAFALAIFCFWNAETLLGMIYDNDISHSAPPFQLLVFTFVAMCVILIFGTYLTALGEMQVLNTIAFVGLIVNVALNFYLIPKMGVMGVATSTLITQSIVAISQVALVKSRLQLVWNLGHITRFVVYLAILFFGVGYAAYFQLHIILQLLFVGICLMLFKVIDVRLFFNLLKSKGA
jgi:O-antigen/teichoic acid export membrane protein